MSLDWPGIGPFLVASWAWWALCGLAGLGIAIATWENT